MSYWFDYMVIGFGVTSIIGVIIMYFQIRKYENITDVAKCNEDSK